jgi:hypothetical protein
MNYAIKMDSCGVIYLPSCMKIGTGIEALLRFLLHKSERPQCWYYWWWGFMIYGLRLHDIRIKFHDDRCRHLRNIRVITATIWEAIILLIATEGIYEVRRWDSFSAIQKLIGGTDIQTHTHTARWFHKPTFIVLNKENRMSLLPTIISTIAVMIFIQNAIQYLSLKVKSICRRNYCWSSMWVST